MDGVAPIACRWRLTKVADVNARRLAPVGVRFVQITSEVSGIAHMTSPPPGFAGLNKSTYERPSRAKILNDFLTKCAYDGRR